MKSPHVFIIIVNWNGYKDTLDCLKSLHEITYKNYTIIIIDNGSTDNSINILRSTYPDIKILENSKNLGYTGGVNTGIKYAMQQNADYVLLLNNDTVVRSNFLQPLIDYVLKENNVGIVGSRINYFNNKDLTQSLGGSFSYYSSYPLKLLSHKQLSTYKDKPSDVDWVSGCSMLIRNSLLQKLIGLDDDYFLYVEDADICMRAGKLEYKVVIVPDSIVWHKTKSSTGGEDSVVYDYYNSRNLLLFANKHLKKIDKFLYTINILRSRLLEILSLIRTRKKKRATAMIRGLLHGLLNIKGYYSKI